MLKFLYLLAVAGLIQVCTAQQQYGIATILENAQEIEKVNRFCRNVKREIPIKVLVFVPISVNVNESDCFDEKVKVQARTREDILLHMFNFVAYEKIIYMNANLNIQKPNVLLDIFKTFSYKIGIISDKWMFDFMIIKPDLTMVGNYGHILQFSSMLLHLESVVYSADVGTDVGLVYEQY
jgi:hypothetical protein